MRHVAHGLVLLFCWAAVAVADQHRFAGRRLEEALRLLQQGGLPIVFSSEVVKPGMTVPAEPRSNIPRQQLDELLAPHGLKAEAGPGRLILVVRDHSAAARDAAGPAPPTARTGDGGSRAISTTRSVRYSDDVIVWGSGQPPTAIGGSRTVFEIADLQTASSVLTADGLDAVHSMPGVIAADDYRTDFSVRGSPYRQIGIVIDGIAAPWLQHSIYGRSDAGSLSMFGSDAVERVTLQAGAYPRRNGDTLGAEVQLNVKEGSRDSTRFTARAGGTSASFVAQGPIGDDGRGSWLAAVRNSYRSWPPHRLSQDDVGFAFADAHAKLVYDVSATHQISVTVLGGRSTLDTVDEPLVSPLGYGIDRAALVTVGLRSTVGSRTIVRQRAFFTGQELVSRLPAGQLAGRSDNRALGYRGEVLRTVAGGLLEAGAEVSRTSGAHDTEAVGPSTLPQEFRADWTTHAAYVNYRREAPGGVSLEGGARVSDSTLVHQHALVPWIRGAWRFKQAWTVNASAGASRQLATLDVMPGLGASSRLAPERATHIDVGIEQRLPGVVWTATLFDRIENDVLDRSTAGWYRNSLSGKTRGIELTVKPDSIARLSGWTSYTYATARQFDANASQAFWSDSDRRHSLNAAGQLQIGRQAIAGLVVRAASGVPIPGYFDALNGILVGGEHRNQVRLPAYVRVDARAQRTFFSAHHSMTVFGEVLNVLDRENQRPIDGIMPPASGEAAGFSQPLMPRRVSIGVEVSLRR